MRVLAVAVVIGAAYLTSLHPSLAACPQLKLRDDYGRSTDCDSRNNDCYDWHPNTGAGKFVWKWSTCCTDGMVRARCRAAVMFRPVLTACSFWVCARVCGCRL